jgi:hypothetical protein
VLVHDSTYTPEDRKRYEDRGFSSVDDAVAAAVAGKVKRLVLFHYDQDYVDSDVDALVARARRLLDEAGARGIEVTGAVEGETPDPERLKTVVLLDLVLGARGRVERVE